MPKKIKLYNIYQNPYASPAPEYDLSVCSECEGGTGEVGSSAWKTQCENCRYVYSIYEKICEGYEDGTYFI